MGTPIYPQPDTEQDDQDLLSQMVRWSMARISHSQHSIRASVEVLERSRRTVEGSMKRLTESQRLIHDPFYRPWCRTDAPVREDAGGQ